MSSAAISGQAAGLFASWLRLGASFAVSVLVGLRVTDLPPVCLSVLFCKMGTSERACVVWHNPCPAAREPSETVRNRHHGPEGGTGPHVDPRAG